MIFFNLIKILVSVFITINLYAGPPIRVSPKPSDNLDYVFKHLQKAMDNWYQLPWYPREGVPVPDPYLNFVMGQFNSYMGGVPRFNPCNNNIILTILTQNRFRDRTATFLRFNNGFILGRSFDGGNSWEYLPPPTKSLPFGEVSQQVIPVTLRYGKDGTLYSLLAAYDMTANPPNTTPREYWLLQRSNNNGNTWSDPEVIFKEPFSGAFTFAEGVIHSGDFRANPFISDLLHFSFVDLVIPSTLWGRAFYFESRDKGRTFTKPELMYTLVNDPEWQRKYFDPAFTSDPNYFTYGGQVILNEPVTFIDENTLVQPILRLFPKVGATEYTQEPSNSFTDRAVVRSTDRGKTWERVAGATEPFVFGFVHDPAFELGEFDLVVVDGGLNIPFVYSPITGRLYFAYMAGNPAVSPDPEVQQFYSHIILNVSYDKGKTWTKPIQVNVTPTDLPIGLQQAFQPSMALTQDGQLLIGYNDFRNYTGGSDPTSFLQTDAWVAVYKEVPENNGGSTGVGLDFVKEIRVTPESFNARVTKFSNFSSFGGGIGISVNDANKVYVNYSVTNENDPSKIILGGYKGMTIDLNNRRNVFLRKFQFPQPSNQ